MNCLLVTVERFSLPKGSPAGRVVVIIIHAVSGFSEFFFFIPGF